MTCKKGEHVGDCMCLRRRHEGCIFCEKKALKVVHEYGRDQNEVITYVKNGVDAGLALYVGVQGLDGDPDEFYLRSSVDILRGVCKYCKHENSDICNECMWLSNIDLEDHWVFDERFNKMNDVK